MFAEIIQLAATCDYDFRCTANPDDPLHYLFAEWVPYYRTKWALSKLLRPRRILEIGVRFGYTAMAFLSASPEAEYLGIDNNSETFGGAEGAVFWARHAMAGLRANFLIADSQTMDEFPQGHYDLIHVDGQQDEQGLHHDLDVALRQGEYVLVDGFFWTPDNFLSASDFLLRNRDAIEYYGVIPGYAGELLIRPKTGIRAALPRVIASSDQLRPAYTRDYYLRNRGAFDSFKKSGGTILQDPRLRAVATLAEEPIIGRALDLGCGRGEVAIALALMGHEVTAIDYSHEAINIARELAGNTEFAPEQLRFICDDVKISPITGLYDIVVAVDLIEGMGPNELDLLYARVAAHLRPNGLFIVRTFPNKWFYQYHYPSRVQKARALGAYLPEEPRTYYEKLMHFNEQSPRVLRRQLRRHFPFVQLWFARHECDFPFENLERCYSAGEMRAAEDLFAVASHSPVSAEVLAQSVRMSPLTETEASRVRVRFCGCPVRLRAGEAFETTVLVSNGSALTLKSQPPNPVHLSYHWMDRAGAMVVFEGERTPLFPSVRAETETVYKMRVLAPAKAGMFTLQATLVQERVRWFGAYPLRRHNEAHIIHNEAHIIEVV